MFKYLQSEKIISQPIKAMMAHIKPMHFHLKDYEKNSAKFAQLQITRFITLSNAQ